MTKQPLILGPEIGITSFELRMVRGGLSIDVYERRTVRARPDGVV